MKTSIIKIILIILAVAVGGYFVITQKIPPIAGRAYAVGDLEINWGVTGGKPIFMVTNMLPGDQITKTFKITNNSHDTRYIALRTQETSGSPLFPGQLEVTIKNGSQDIYGGTAPGGKKTLANLFSESKFPLSIYFNQLKPGQSSTYSITVKFKPTAGNQFQKAKVVFNLLFGVYFKPNPTCLDRDMFGDGAFGIYNDDRHIVCQPKNEIKCRR
jgi:hypothetical protein